VGFFQKYKDAHIPTTHSPTAVKYAEPHVRLQAPLSKRTTEPDESESIEEPSYESGKIESKIIVLRQSQRRLESRESLRLWVITGSCCVGAERYK
jgi:hypothetical protein